MPFLQENPRILRPANHPGDVPGRGYVVAQTPNGTPLGILNLMGRVFFNNIMDCPFRYSLDVLEHIHQETPVVIVDFHAEATSEKVALGWFLDGRVSALLGTHTHVQTADERILPEGTAYITDVGMTGPKNSVIGIKPDLVLDRFLTQLPVRFQVASGPSLLNAVILDINPASGKALSIRRILIDGV
jgi:hypothetical protein